MSRESAVRIPLRAESSQSRRTLDERLFVRFPGLLRAALRAVLGLPIHSRLRQRLLGRAFRKGYAATTRGDYDVGLLAYAPDLEIQMTESAAVADDLVGTYHGYDGWRRLVTELVEVFEFRWLPEEVLDCGPQAVVTLRLETRGRGSGVPVTHHAFDVFTWRDGLVTRHEIIGDWQLALEAVGLRK